MSTADADPLGTLFDLLPIGAYRSAPDGRQLRANAALVRLNGYPSEAEMLAGVRDIATEWYVEPGRRDEFRRMLERDGVVIGFVSEVWRHKTRERIWISEHAHVVRDAQGRVVYYEGTVEEVSDRVEAAARLARSEEQLRRITAQIPGMAYRAVVDATGARRFVFVSEGVRELFGVEPEAAIADAAVLERRVHPEDRQHVQAAIAAAGTSGGRVVAEFRVRGPGGRQRWAEVHSATLAMPDGTRVRNGVIVNVTERRLAEEALRENEAHWKLALEATGDGVWDWNLATGEERCSRLFLEMYGFAEGEIEARRQTFDDRTHPDDVAQMEHDRDAHLAGRTPRYVNEHRVRCKDGSWKWILSRGLVIERDAEGRPLRMIGTHTDISARKAAEALRAERDRAEAADRAKSQMLSRVSHELRTPLNAVLGFAQLLDGRRDGLDTRQRDWVAHILASGRHLLGLVEDVLDLSSAQTGELVLALADVELWTVVDAAWAMLDADAQRAGVTLERHAETPFTVVRADRRRLKQVLLNLLSNAVKYNRPGGTVRLAAQIDRGMVEWSVEDSGAGMSTEQTARLFRPFDRLGAEHGSVEGSGIGLALAHQLVLAMAGTIAVASTPGRGTTFTVRLPAAATPR